MFERYVLQMLQEDENVEKHSLYAKSVARWGMSIELEVAVPLQAIYATRVNKQKG